MLRGIVAVGLLAVGLAACGGGSEEAEDCREQVKWDLRTGILGGRPVGTMMLGALWECDGDGDAVRDVMDEIYIYDRDFWEEQLARWEAVHARGRESQQPPAG